MAAVRFPAASGWLAAASLAGFALVALAARARTAEPVIGPANRTYGPPPTPTPGAGPPLDLPGRPPPNGRSLPIPWSFLGLLLTGLLLLAVIWLVVVLGPRLPTGRRARRVRTMTEPISDDVVRQVSDTLAATAAQLAGGQIRDAVILCWHRLQQTADAAGLRRSPADTSSELAERLLAGLPLSEEPLRRLAALYREARFSSHPIPESAVAQARADLARLRSELTPAASLRSPAEPRHG